MNKVEHVRLASVQDIEHLLRARDHSSEHLFNFIPNPNNNSVFSVYCTTDSWYELNIRYSETPDNLPVRYPTEVTLECIAWYTSTAVVKCETSGKFTYTGDKPTCQTQSGL